MTKHINIDRLGETWYDKQRREAGEELQALLFKPIALPNPLTELQEGKE